MRTEDRKLLQTLARTRRPLRSLLGLVTPRSVVCAFKKNTVLWARGEQPKNVYIVLSGRIALLEDTYDTSEALIVVFEPGDVFSHRTTTMQTPYMFSAKTLDEARVWIMPGEQFRRAMKKNRNLLEDMMASMSDHWQRMAVHVRDLKKFSANQRLGRYLLGRVARKSGGGEIRLTDDQLLIAGLLGVTRESLSRSFAQLRELGVKKRGRVVTIADIGKLRRFSKLDGG